MVTVKMPEDSRAQPYRIWPAKNLHMLVEEIPSMARFAFPIVFAQAGFMFMGVVDTAMLGKLGSAELAGTGVARSLFWLVAIFATGMISALDVLASHALGAVRIVDLNRILLNGIKFAVWLSIILTPVLLLASKALSLFNYDPQILEHAQTYFNTMALSLPFMLLFTAIQRYWQSQKRTRFIVAIVVIANVINYFLNSVLIFGEMGMPALGVMGAGISAIASRALMFAMIMIYTLRHLSSEKGALTVNPRRLFVIDRDFLKRMLRLGLPAGAHQAFEVGAFSLITLFAARLLAVEAAAHQIVVIISSFTYMFPIGLSNAAAFRVGHFVGQRDNERARWAGHAAILLGVTIMFVSALLLYFAPGKILALFTHDVEVIAVAKDIIVFAAMFQIFDALQSCAIGALRGAGNTAYASVFGAIGFYGIALPVGTFLCFHVGLRLVGLWIGLATGLFFIAAAALFAWLTIKPALNLSADLAPHYPDDVKT